MRHDNPVKLALIIIIVNVLSIDVRVLTVNAIWPFDQLMSSNTNQTTNQISSSLTTESEVEEENPG